MPIAKSGRRNIDPVFGKLDKHDQNRLVGNESDTLQYPVDLGTDEYNQFVLFTIFDRKNEEVREQTRKVRQAIQLRDDQRAIEQEERAKEISKMTTVSAPPFSGMYGYSLFGLANIWNQSRSKEILDSSITAVEGFGVGLADSTGLSDGYKTGRQRNLEDEQEKLDKLLANAAGNTAARSAYFQNSTAQKAFKYGQFEKLGIKDRRTSSATGRTRLAAATEQQKKSIALYIPNKIVNNGSINYSGVDFSAVNQIFQIGKGNLSSVAPSLKRGLANAIDGLSNIVGVNINANEAIEAITGLVINPRQEQIFQGVSSRSFDFTFSLAPRNPDEAVEVSKIIRTFREFSHPAIDTSSFFLEIPAEFEIRYYKIFNPGDANSEVVTENLFLNKIGRCALTNINVDYTPNGINATFPDGSPVRTSLTMTFTELRPLTRQDIEEGF